MTINSEDELVHTQEKIAELERMLASARRRLSASPNTLASMLALYERQHSELQQEVRDFLGVSEVPHGALELAFEMKDGVKGVTSLSVLESVSGSFRNALTGIAETLAAGTVREAGRPFARIARAVDLKVVATGIGSFTLALEYPVPTEEEGPSSGDLKNLAERSIGVLSDGIDWLTSSAEAPPESLRDEKLRGVVLREMKRLAPDDRSPIAWVEVKRQKLGEAGVKRLTPETSRRIETIIERTRIPESVSIEGVLREIDLDSSTFELKDQKGKKHKCKIPDELLREAFTSIVSQRAVIVRGKKSGRILDVAMIQRVE